MLPSASTGTSSIASVSTTAYDAFYANYVVKGGSAKRAGHVIATWSGSAFVNHNEISTLDIGNSSDITLNVTMSEGNAIFQAFNTSGTAYQIKTQITSL